MEIRLNGTKYLNYDKWDNVLNAPYNYEKYGLLNHIMSHVILNSNNEILNIIINYFEKSLIFVMKYIDILKHFKNFHRSNR